MLSRPRWAIGVGLVLLTTVVLIPTWIVLPPDDEDLWIVIAPTVFHYELQFVVGRLHVGEDRRRHDLLEAADPAAELDGGPGTVESRASYSRA